MKLHDCVGAVLAVFLLLQPVPARAAPSPPQVHIYEVLDAQHFKILRSHAHAFVSAKALQPYTLEAGETPATWFEIRYQGRVVMKAENAAPELVVRVPAGVDLLAPDILQLRDRFHYWLEYLNGCGRRSPSA
ncbi:TPA: hypothetical protein QDZ34_000175 [Stenotrophomonas maltophilia]|nr:hypothetical protein [Stenotrophomonas maltophilia]HDS0951585.1 hypothetical protein [Stenotrophomonas maltophilia]HDS1024109.1 hypothetical protein [Stenotrophomonas maltophilia]HDS1028063.1 hypothetical protein [Stenotrophomonas maltophilia]HDS1028396.1 hypothetical protein [Stenotrophomonas maltophilia]